MNAHLKKTVERSGRACGVVVIGLLCVAGCAGGLVNEPPPSQAQLAQSAEEACSGVPATMREKGLVAFRGNIAGTAPLSEDVAVGKVKFSHGRGETVALRAAPNMTAPWLGRINSCHVSLARAGQLTDTGAADPFVVPGTTVRIEESYAGYVVTIHAVSDEVAADVVQRTNAMLASPSGPATAQLLTR